MTNFWKSIKKVLIFAGILLAIYNIVLFVIAGFDGHASTFWCSYVFMLVTFAFFAIVYIFNFKKGFELKDWIFGYPALKWSLIHVALELVVSTIFMFTPASLIKVAFIIQFLIFCAFLGVILSCFAGKRYAISEEKVDKKVYYIRSLGVSLETIRNEITDSVLKSNIEKLIEDVRHSDPMSHDSLSTIEQEIEQSVSTLREYVFDGNIDNATTSIKCISNLVKERNATCKISKKL